MLWMQSPSDCWQDTEKKSQVGVGREQQSPLRTPHKEHSVRMLAANLDLAARYANPCTVQP